MTPNQLASELGVSGVRLRGWLRLQFPRPEADKWSRWELSAEEVTAARAEFAGRAERREQRAQAVSSGQSDWYWEGNVQAVLVRYLRSEGWTIETTANTAAKAQGDDIRARKSDQILRVEVKGWPTKGRYADPLRAGEVKRTQPSTQAGHWYSQALLHVLRDLGRYPQDRVAIGLPDWPRFRSLIADTERPLRRLGIAVYLVAEDGTVEVRLPLA